MSVLENFWYCAIASIQLGAAPVAVQIGDRRIAVYRSAAGRPGAVADHCCHRGYPLSHGKVVDDDIVCGFHGWRFNAAGQCVEIPSHPPAAKIPAACRTRAYPCAEQDGYVWIWIGRQEPGPPPQIPEFSGRRWLQGARVVACNFVKALEINVDIAHIPFVHPTHPVTRAAARSGFVAQEYEIRPADGGFVVFSPPAGSAQEPVPPGAVQEFKLPGVIAMRLFGFVVYFHVVPMGEKACRIEFLITNYMPGGDQVTWVGGGAAMMDEDAAVLEAIERGQAADWCGPISVEADVPTLALRKLLDAAFAGRAEEALPPRRVFTAMSARFDFTPAPTNAAAEKELAR